MKRHLRGRAYADLMADCKDKGLSLWLFTVEVGCRGFPARSVWKLLTRLGMSGRTHKTTTRRLRQDFCTPPPRSLFSCVTMIICFSFEPRGVLISIYQINPGGGGGWYQMSCPQAHVYGMSSCQILISDSGKLSLLHVQEILNNWLSNMLTLNATYGSS